MTGALHAFRSLRLLRVFKIARSWSNFRNLLAKIFVTVKDVSTFTLLTLIIIIICALLGMELFGFKVKFNIKTDEVVPIDSPLFDSEDSLPPRANFDTVEQSLTTIFIIFIGDDWNEIMYKYYRSQGIIAKVFFPVIYISLNLIMLNLFLAILLSNFENISEDRAE